MQLVKVTAPSHDALASLEVAYDVAYVTGDRTATLAVTDQEVDRLRAEGYEIGATISDPAALDARAAERQAALRAQNRSLEYAENGAPSSASAVPRPSPRPVRS